MATKIRESPEGTDGYEAPSKKRRFRLKTPRDVTSLLQQVISGVWNDDLPPEKARVVIYAASIMVRVFEAVDLSERIKVLEERLQK